MLRQRDTDMTKGSVGAHLLRFATPYLFGNIFQQLYNTVDSVVVGNYVGKEALAAVGGVGPVINMLIGFFAGLAAGASVVISRYYGAHDQKKVHAAVHTTMAMSLIFSAVVTVAGLFLVPTMLRMMHAPKDVEAQAAEYLRIYFAGVSGLLIYNIGAGILRAVGDSRRPLYFLIFSALLNTGLDILFVRFCKMGIRGAAIATVIAQGVSAVLVLVVLTTDRGACRLNWRAIRVNGPVFGKICAIGMPTAVQTAILSVSNVFVQSFINRFGSASMAAWTSYSKIEALFMLPVTSLSTANTVFTSQNLGAGDRERVKSGTKYTFWSCMGVTALLLVPMLLLAPQLIGLFNRDEEVLRVGTQVLHLMAPFYLICVADSVYRSTLNGAGATKFTMVATLGGYVVFRQLYLFLAQRLFGTFTSIALGYPLGWVLCSVCICLYYWSGKWDTGEK